MARYGGYFSASPPSTTASCTNASTSVTLAAALDFQDATKFSHQRRETASCSIGAALLQASPRRRRQTYALWGTAGATTYNYKYVLKI